MINGTNQFARTLRALHPEFIQMDERSIFDMAEFMLSYSNHVKFIDFQHRQLGTWYPFLMNDPIFITVRIASTKLEHFKATHDELIANLEGNPREKSKIIAKIAENTLSLCKYFYVWENLFVDSNYAGPLLNEIINGRKFLEPIIQQSLSFQQVFTANQFLLDPESVGDRKKNTNIEEDFKNAYKSTVFIVENAKKSFEALVDNPTGNHQPHIGLLFSFLKLLSFAQQELNALTERHLNFYYHRILRQQAKQPKPIAVMVGIIPKNKPFILEQASDFVFTTDDKVTVPFQNQHFTEISQVKITDLKSVFISKHSPFSSQPTIDSVTLSTIYQSTYHQGEAKQVIQFTESLSQDLPPTFGEDQETIGISQKTMDKAEIGFLVSSSALLVEKGNTSFDLEFSLSENSSLALQKEVQALYNQKRRQVTASDDSGKNGIKKFLYMLVSEAFIVYVSAQQGWIPMKTVQVMADHVQHKLIVKIKTERVEDIPVPYITGVHGPIEGIDAPSIRFMLNNAAHYPPYQLLRLLEVKEVEILASSQDIFVNLEVSNQVGKLDTSNPFMPFGPLPTIDSYVKIYNPLILNKYLASLQFNIHWAGLPKNATGFQKYYQAYQKNILNASFKGTLTITSDFKSRTKRKDSIEQVFDFFQTRIQSGDEYLKPETQLKVNLDLVDMTRLKEPNSSDAIAADRAHLSLKLTEPENFAFGHQAYAGLIADVSFFNSKYPKRKKEIPNSPYTPIIEKIEFNYTNRAKENLFRIGNTAEKSIKIHHLYPFGHQEVYPSSVLGPTYLLPQLNGKGSLIIGLHAVKPDEIINLGFKLYPAYFIHTITHPPVVKWEYMEKNMWKPLDQLLMEDTTLGMLQSGLVKIRIPSTLDIKNTRLSEGKLWLRVVQDGMASINSRLITVFTNAVMLTQNQLVAQEGTIDYSMLSNLNGNAVSNPKISGVLGPFHVEVPKVSNTIQQQRTRISENLRHRKRASTTWDIERLVLENFPQIGRVLAYGRTDAADHLVKNSNIQVVIIPKAPDTEEKKWVDFRAPFKLLQEVKKYLQPFLSPFSKLEVCNPVFEKLKIRGAVRFTDAQQAGYYRDLLERELINFLSPNPLDFQQDKGFLNAIFKVEIQNFIESRPYVAYITEFSVLQIIEVQGKFKIIDTAVQDKKIEILKTISPYAILTSAESHQLKILQHAEVLDAKIASVGDFSIESDFIVKPH